MSTNKYVYIIFDGTGSDRDQVFLSEEAVYKVWVEKYASDVTESNLFDQLDEKQKEEILNLWNDATLEIVPKIRKIDHLLKGNYLQQDCVQIKRMKINEN